MEYKISQELSASIGRSRCSSNLISWVSRKKSYVKRYVFIVKVIYAVKFYCANLKERGVFNLRNQVFISEPCMVELTADLVNNINFNTKNWRQNVRILV